MTKHQRDQRRRGVPGALLSLAMLLVATACSSSGSGTLPASTGTGTSKPLATESAPPGDIPDNQAFVPYSPSSHAYTVRVPEGWAMTRKGQATLFTDKFNSVRFETLTAPKAPSVGTARASDLPAIKAAAHGFVPGTVTSVARTAGPAVKITYRADSAPNPVTGKVVVEAVERYEFWRHGIEAVLTLSAPVGSDNVDPWRKITDSFGWKR